MVGWILLTFWMSANSTADQAPAFNHVRSAESEVRTLIADGYGRSATFKGLVDRVEHLSGVVYVASTVKLSQGMSGALLHQPAGMREMPVLRVLVKTNLARDEAISVIAHELQHVIEAVSGLPASGEFSISAAFDTLDPTARARGVREYETDAATNVTARVRSELRRQGR